MQRVGDLGDGTETDRRAIYDWVGQWLRELVHAQLPAGWSFAGKRVLDFGCGAGRSLRHFYPEVEAGAEVWGTDVHSPSIEWCQANLSPPMHLVRNGEIPPLALPSQHFDLVIAVSVFTHLIDTWAAWLLELHRVLRPEGILVATFHGPAMVKELLGESFDDSRFGMNALRPGASWDVGGPFVFHAPWWLEAHWGRAFTFLKLLPEATRDFPSHGVVVAQPRAERVSAQTLLYPEPDEPREATAALHNVRQLLDELVRLQAQ